MRLIAHRGNMSGPNPERENTLSYLQEALDAGFDVEMDVWLKDGFLYAGHDQPKDPVPLFFLRNQRIWTHCKNVEALTRLSIYPDINRFFQDQEMVVLTSQGYMWAHSNVRLPTREMVHTRLEYMPGVPETHGLCSDHVAMYQKHRAEARRLPFDLLVVDIDGVMTDGTKVYDRQGQVVAKRYCDLDFTALKRFKAAGIKVCFLSGDRTVNEAMAKTRRIEFWHNEPGLEKAELLSTIAQAHQTTLNRTAYVGDDYYDIGALRAVGHSFCPANAIASVRTVAKTALGEPGQGVLARIYDHLSDQIPYAFPVDSKEINP